MDRQKVKYRVVSLRIKIVEYMFLSPFRTMINIVIKWVVTKTKLNV